jgi:hypothetical protein
MMIQTNQPEKSIVELLKSMNSADAAEWLVNEFPIDSPDYGQVFDLIKRRSWRRSEQVMLCEYYMQKSPFASARPYETFARMMSANAFITVLKKFIPDEEEDQRLFLYHLAPVLHANFGNNADGETVRTFLSSLE